LNQCFTFFCSTTLSFPLCITAAIGQDKECLSIYPPPEECLDHNPHYDGADRGRGLVVVSAKNDSGSDHLRAIDRGRSLLQEEGFTVKAGDLLEANFASTSTQEFCFCTCGEFAADVLRGNRANCFDGFPPIMDLGNNNDDNFFVNGYDGGGGSNFLTSKSTLPLCPSRVTFDFAFDYLRFFPTANNFTKPRTLTLEVIDTSNSDQVILSEQIDDATIQVPDAGLTSGLTSGAGFVSIDLKSEDFQFCEDNLRLRFNWNIPEAFTGPSQFILDNVVVTPVRRLASKQDTNQTTAALIYISFLDSTQYSPCAIL
jgi:hypothetical protein